MKLSMIALSFFMFFGSFNLEDIRILYKKSDGSKENTILLFNKLEAVKTSDGNVLMAYKGASIAMKGRFEKGVKQKSIVFKNGVLLVEDALKNEPNNIEIRFIRLTIQQNSPKILKYKSHITEDKDFILSHYEKIESNKLKNYIRDYILNSNNFTESEKRVTSQP